MEQRGLGRRALFPKELRAQLVKARKPALGVLKTLLSPGKTFPVFDQDLGKLLGLTAVTTKQVRYGNRSLTYEEWEKLSKTLLTLAEQEGLKEAVEQVLADKDAFMRPYAGEDVPQPAKGRRKGSKNLRKIEERESPSTEISQVRGKSDIEFQDSVIVLTIKGVSVRVPKETEANLRIGVDLITLTFPR